MTKPSALEMDDVTLDGGVIRDPDGTFSVVARFGHVPDEKQAEQLSGWLQRLINEHLSEIAD
jgi:hypothetical protein